MRGVQAGRLFLPDSDTDGEGGLLEPRNMAPELQYCSASTLRRADGGGPLDTQPRSIIHYDHTLYN